MTTNMVTAGPCTPALSVSATISSITFVGSASRLQQVVSGLVEVVERDGWGKFDKVSEIEREREVIRWRCGGN